MPGTVKLDSAAFIELCHKHSFNISDMLTEIKALHPDYNTRPSRIIKRIEMYRRKGLLPLDSGNYVSTGELLKGTSTLYAADGNIKLQWVKTDVPKQQFLDNYKEAITELAEMLPSLPTIKASELHLNDLATVYISNDLHIGAYMWHEEVGNDWDVNIATKTIRNAYDFLFSTTPASKIGVVVDLGDLTDVDSHKNMTPQSGHLLDTDGRYPKILRAAYESLIYGITKALEKHELVYFYGVAGNHDPASFTAVREVIRMVFKDNPRVIVDESPAPIKYFQYGKTLLQFAHGDGLKMQNSGEVMAYDQMEIFSDTRYRYSHFGHVHKDSVVENKLNRAESHRNLAPVNAWAYHKGYRGPLGTMKAITYSPEYGEVTRQTYNVAMN